MNGIPGVRPRLAMAVALNLCVMVCVQLGTVNAQTGFGGVCTANGDCLGNYYCSRSTSTTGTTRRCACDPSTVSGTPRDCGCGHCVGTPGTCPYCPSAPSPTLPAASTPPPTTKPPVSPPATTGPGAFGGGCLTNNDCLGQYYCVPATKTCACDPSTGNPSNCGNGVCNPAGSPGCGTSPSSLPPPISASPSPMLPPTSPSLSPPTPPTSPLPSGTCQAGVPLRTTTTPSKGQCDPSVEPCCVANTPYPTYRCSPSVSPSATPAIFTYNQFTASGDGGGASECTETYQPNEQVPVVALSTGWYAGGSRCNKNIKITYNGVSVTAMVVDECDSTQGCDLEHAYQQPCRNNVVDASKGVWDALKIPASGPNYEGEIASGITWVDA